MNKSIDPYEDWDASYVLGGLSADEHREYERHLAECADCSNAVAAISHIPGYLGRIDVQTAITLDQVDSVDSSNGSWNESEFIQRLALRADQVRRKARSRQKIGMVAAALISLTIGVSVGVVLHSSGSGDKNITTSIGKALHVTNLNPETITASFRVKSEAWGTRIDWNCSYPSVISSAYGSTNYDLVVTDTSGQQSVVSTWSASGSSAVGLSTTSDLQLSHIKSLEIVLSGSQTPLVVGTNI